VRTAEVATRASGATTTQCIGPSRWRRDPRSSAPLRLAFGLTLGSRQLLLVV
jgi:hypothetical protein